MMKTKTLLKLTILSFITILHFMNEAKAGSVKIINENIPLVKAMEYARVGFLHENKRALTRIDLPAEGKSKTVPLQNGKYERVTVYIKVKHSGQVFSSNCIAEQENYLKIEDKTTVNLNVKLVDDQFTCTLTEPDESSVVR